MSRQTKNFLETTPEQCFNDLLVSLNLGSAFVFAALVYVAKSAASLKTLNDSLYLAIRSIYRVCDFLGFHSANPVSTGAVGREIPNGMERPCSEITLALTFLGVSAALFLGFRLLMRFERKRSNFPFITLPLSLFAGPGLYLFVLWLTWNWPRPWTSTDRSFYFQNPLFLVFVTEFLCLCVTSFRAGKRNTGWGLALFTLVHWSFWAFVFLNETSLAFFPLYTRDAALALLFLSTLIWVWREKPLIRRLQETVHRGQKGLSILGAGAVVLAVAVWHPARNVDLSHPQDWKTVEMSLSRGPCYGSCASYTITVHGNGQIDYTGYEHHARKETRKSGSIGQEQISEILRALDGAQFSTLDSRAFRWSFDTPSIGVRLSVDGKSKEVVSDVDNMHSTVGRQAHFLKVADEIDAILKSAKWTDCTGECGDSKTDR